MTINTLPLKDQCSTITICFNLKPNYTAFLFPNEARQHRFYWMDDGDSFRDLKRDISYLIDPRIQKVISSFNTQTDTTTTVATTTTTSTTCDFFDQIKHSYLTYFILLYMILLFIGVGLILFFQIRYNRRYRHSYNHQLRASPTWIQKYSALFLLKYLQISSFLCTNLGPM